MPVPDPGPPGLRLPGDVKPSRYRLDLTIVPEAQTARGSVAIEAQVMKPTWVIWLDATELTIGHATIGGRPARVIPGGADYIGLSVGSELPVGPVVITVEWTAPIDHTKSRGIYSEKEGADTYAYSFFEPIDARRAFPCFDEPSYKVPWQLTFHVKADHVALANAPVVSEAPEGNGMKKVVLAESKPLPSYLVAFVVGPFELVDGGTAGRANTPIRFIIPKGRGAELGYAKSITPRVVTALEDYFDMAYPYIKLDVAVVPRFWGTMEHPGIVAMGQPLTLIRPDQATRSRKERYTNILEHELAHYWFGDYVTLAWWDDTWLNEALGEWMDLIITDAAEPGWKVLDQRIRRATEAMDADETLSTKSIRQAVTTREQIESSFDGAITYLKGSTVLRMYELSIGAERWRAFIRSYMAAHAWGNATADDLFAAVRTQLGAENEAGLRSFIEQPGVPRISATLSCTGSPKLALHQQRSLPAGVVDPVARRWSVPVCVRYGDAKTTHRACTTLAATDGELALDGPCPTWTVLNADGTGYYRSVVDPKLATDLLTPRSAVARIAKLTAAEKMMLVADVRAAVDRDELSIDKALALAPLLARDPDERIARTAFTASELRKDGLDDALFAKFNRFYLATYKPLATKLGWKRGATDSDDRQQLRQAALTTAYYDPALAKQATKLTLAWLDDRTAIDDDLVSVVLLAATHHGDADLFDRLLVAARTPRDRNEKQRLLASLGGFTDPAIVARALGLTLSTDFDLRDSLGILYSVVGGRETRTLGLAFIEAHLDELLARLRDDESSWLLEFFSGVGCDQATYDRVVPIVAARAKKIGGAELAVTRALEASRQCIANSQRQLPALKAFLR
ncbi:M1 family metallopeptidase [soil metagenome]